MEINEIYSTGIVCDTMKIADDENGLRIYIIDSDVNDFAEVAWQEGVASYMSTDESYRCDTWVRMALKGLCRCL